VITIVGHFGTLYSYATVAGRVAEALRDCDLLAGCQNLDSAWHPRWSHLSRPVGSGTHALLVTAPHHYVADFPDSIGRGRSAIFVSPNTDKLSDEHAETISKFGLAIAPSSFCARTTIMSALPDAVTVLPLGSPVSSSFCKSDRIYGAPVNVVHFTSDQAWPSRKGTEVLLEAWASRRHGQPAKLTIHGPPSLRKDALYKIVDLGIDETVEYVASGKFGSTDEELMSLYADADLIVAPSRSEGFGMMMLGALVARVPLVTTCNTGHAEFLCQRPGAWLPIPTPHSDLLPYEFGDAPVVEARTLAESLSLALTPFARDWMMNAPAPTGAAADPGWGTWDHALLSWTKRLKEWMEET
jgi:glycosyltransferase involved in cell wall biosynthesis